MLRATCSPTSSCVKKASWEGKIPAEKQKESPGTFQAMVASHPEATPAWPSTNWLCEPENSRPDICEVCFFHFFDQDSGFCCSNPKLSLSGSQRQATEPSMLLHAQLKNEEAGWNLLHSSSWLYSVPRALPVSCRPPWPPVRMITVCTWTTYNFLHTFLFLLAYPTFYT